MKAGDPWVLYQSDRIWPYVLHPVAPQETGTEATAAGAERAPFEAGWGWPRLEFLASAKTHHTQ